MAEIRFSVTPQAAAYLEWIARNILFEKTGDAAARHLVMKEIERLRREHYRDEPLFDPGPANAVEEKGKPGTAD